MQAYSFRLARDVLFASVVTLASIACDREQGANKPRSGVHPGGHALDAKMPAPVEVSVKASGQLGPGRGTLIVEIQPPDGAELTEGAPFRLEGRGADLTFPKQIDTKLHSKDLPVRLPLDVSDGAQGPIHLDLTYYYCMKGNAGSCRPERAKLSVDIDMSGSTAGGEAHVVHKPAA